MQLREDESNRDRKFESPKIMAANPSLFDEILAQGDSVSIKSRSRRT